MSDFAGIPNELKGSLQENLITLLVQSDKHCQRVVDGVPLKLWSNESIREIATVAYAYIAKYGRAPKDHLPDLLEARLGNMKPVSAEFMVTVLENIQTLVDSGGFNEDYVVGLLSKFVRLQKLKSTVVALADAAEQGDVDAADDVVEKHQRFSEQYGPTAGVELTRASDMQMEPIVWLWLNWLALGMFHLIAGAKGTLKTTLMLWFAAAVTSPRVKWPDNTRSYEPMTVVMWSGEDNPKTTLLPRLAAMGADVSRVHFVESMVEGGVRRPFDPAKDMPKLAEKLETIGGRIGLVIIDSIVSAVAGDSHKNAETRRGLQPVIDLAEQFNCAVVGITHFTKGTAGRDPVERVTGSLAFAALARVVMVTVKMKAPDEYGRDRILTRAASNIGPDGGGYYYAPEQVEVSPSITAQRVIWRGPAEGSAQELLRDAEAGKQKPSEFLRNLLSAGPMLAAEAIAKAEDEGYTAKAMENARAYLKVKTRKLGVEKGWEWSLEDWPVDGDAKPTKH